MAETTYLGKDTEEDPNCISNDVEDLLESILQNQPTTNYRHCTLGKTLIDTLDALIDENQISQSLSSKILDQFDRSMLNALNQRLTARVTFRASKLRTYRFIDGEWNFILNNVEFREYNSLANVDKMKIVAFNARRPDPSRAQSGKRHWKKQGAQNDSRKNGAGASQRS